MKIEDAIKRYESWAEDDRIDLRIRKEHEQIAEWLKELKELKADKPQGEWKPKNHHTDYCSNCGFEETQWRTADYNFCPSCGARMKGADDEIAMS